MLVHPAASELNTQPVHRIPFFIIIALACISPSRYRLVPQNLSFALAFSSRPPTDRKVPLCCSVSSFFVYVLFHFYLPVLHVCPRTHRLLSLSISISFLFFSFSFSHRRVVRFFVLPFVSRYFSRLVVLFLFLSSLLRSDDASARARPFRRDHPCFVCISIASLATSRYSSRRFRRSFLCFFSPFLSPRLLACVVYRMCRIAVSLVPTTSTAECVALFVHVHCETSLTYS